jgi:hypothetical protein
VYYVVRTLDQANTSRLLNYLFINQSHYKDGDIHATHFCKYFVYWSVFYLLSNKYSLNIFLRSMELISLVISGKYIIPFYFHCCGFYILCDQKMCGIYHSLIHYIQLSIRHVQTCFPNLPSNHCKRCFLF